MNDVGERAVGELSYVRIVEVALAISTLDGEVRVLRVDPFGFAARNPPTIGRIHIGHWCTSIYTFNSHPIWRNNRSGWG